MNEYAIYSKELDDLFLLVGHIEAENEKEALKIAKKRIVVKQIGAE